MDLHGFARLVVGVVASFAIFAPRAASACQPAYCNVFRWALPRGNVPANLPAAVVFSPQTGDPDAGTLVEPTITFEGAKVPVDITATDGRSVLKFREPLVAGRKYLIEWSGCPSGTAPQEFTATAAAPLPTALGALTAEVKRGLAFAALDSCQNGGEAAIANLSITPSTTAAPWMTALEFTTIVDGVEWAKSNLDSTHHGRKYAQVYALCRSYAFADFDLGPPPAPGVAQGRHTISVVASLPGGEPLPAITTEVELVCPPGADAGADGGAEAGTDGGTDAATAAVPEAGDGCTCVMGAGAARVTEVGVAWALAALVSIRRRLARG